MHNLRILFGFLLLVLGPDVWAVSLLGNLGIEVVPYSSKNKFYIKAILPAGIKAVQSFYMVQGESKKPVQLY